MAGLGHNSHDRATARRVQGWIQRLEGLEEEIRVANAEKSEVFKEAKAAGFDVNAIRGALRFRRDPEAAIERSRALNEVLALLGAVTAPALPAPQPGVVIDGLADGTPVATRVHVRDEDRVHARGEGEDTRVLDARQTDLEEFTGSPQGDGRERRIIGNGGRRTQESGA